MKKLIKLIAICTCIVIFAVLIKTGKISELIESYDYSKVEKYTNENASNLFYYNKLNDVQKRMYISILEGVKKERQSISLGFFTIESEEFTTAVTKAMYAFMLDNPEYFYVSSEYSIEYKDFGVARYGKVKLNYTVTGSKLKEQKKAFNDKIDQIIGDCIVETMTDYEKELALHDYLAKSVKYYTHEAMSEIPDNKHLAYSALVENSAVCDGISKAFKVLMDKVGVECIITMGVSDNEPHAWNMVKLDDDYYHVDITANNIKVDGQILGVASHLYFNLTDSEISKTSTQDDEFVRPEANGTKYDYYTLSGKIINSNLNFKGQLEKIVDLCKDSNILELRIVNVSGAAQMLVQYLYSLNFNNYKTKNITTVNYVTFNNVYVIQK